MQHSSVCVDQVGVAVTHFSHVSELQEEEGEKRRGWREGRRRGGGGGEERGQGQIHTTSQQMSAVTFTQYITMCISHAERSTTIGI